MPLSAGTITFQFPKNTMNSALTNNATNLASSLNGEAGWDFYASARRASNKDISKKGLTLGRADINRQRLIEKCKVEYRMHFVAIFGKTDRLPSDVFEALERSVDTVIAERLSEIHPQNVVSYRKSFAVKGKDLNVVHRIVLTGENTISLEEQHLGIELALGIQNKRLDELMAKKTPDHNREKQVKSTIAQYTLVKSFIEAEQAHQRKLAQETAVK